MKKHFLLLFLILGLLPAFGCSSIFSYYDGNTYNNNNCLPIDVLPTPIIDDSYRYYVILVEGSEEYIEYRDKGSEILADVLSEVLEPGDQVTAIWMEISNNRTDEAIFFSSEIEQVPIPDITHESRPNLTPSPTPLLIDAPTTSKQQHQNEIDEIQRNNSRIEEEHNCEYVYPLRKNNNDNLANWQESQAMVISQEISKFQNHISSIQPDVMSVFEALHLASDIFADVCDQGIYDDCQLIIVSNMGDWRSIFDSGEIKYQVQEMNIDFSNVSVSVIWLECKFFSDLFLNKCKTRLNTWVEHFSSFNASEDQGNLIFLNQDNIVDRLVRYLGGEK